MHIMHLQPIVNNCIGHINNLYFGLQIRHTTLVCISKFMLGQSLVANPSPSLEPHQSHPHHPWPWESLVDLQSTDKDIDSATSTFDPWKYSHIRGAALAKGYNIQISIKGFDL